MSEVVFDVLIVGAGPAGSTVAYYLCEESKKNGGKQLSVAILDKEKFPRDKYCGDAWCKQALEILEEMGVLQQLEAKGLVNETLAGGFVSPSGHSFIVNDHNVPISERNMTTRAYSIKRIICDEAMVRRAQEVGAQLFEEMNVCDTVFDPMRQIWTVKTTNTNHSFKCKLLIACDGSASTVSRRLGIVQGPPEGVAARQYIKAGTHNFKADGVLLYPEYTLPGYMALFRHYDGTLDLGSYFLPGGAAKESDIAEIYATKVLLDPFISRALGKKFVPLERVKVASLRLGGVPQSYSDNLLIIGDSAGMIDPLTGEGIHTAMIASKMAALHVCALHRGGLEFSAPNLKRFHADWMHEFGNDFVLSALASKGVQRAPYLMDAVPIAAAAKGVGKDATTFFANFGAVMTGVLPKSTFLRPSMALPLLSATGTIVLKRIIGGSRSYYEEVNDAYREREGSRKTSWDAQCLIDPKVEVGRVPSQTERVEAAVSKMFAWGGKQRRVLVAFGSEYGYSEDIARRLCDSLDRAKVASPRLVNLAHFELIDFSKERFFFCVCSTAGDGDAPTSARAFLDALENSELDLKGVTVAVLAPGDSAYPHFCEAGKILKRLLVWRGGFEAIPFKTLDGVREDEVSAWIEQVVSCVGASKQTEELEEADYLVDNAKKKGTQLLSEPRASRKEPFPALLRERKRLTEGGEEKWHIVLDVSKDHSDLVKFECGDAVGVVCENDDEEVDAFLCHFPHLRDKREEIKRDKDLKTLPHGFFALAKLGETKVERHEWISDVCTRLKVLLSPPESLSLFAALLPLKPRFYSIASSPSNDVKQIHLCLARVAYERARARGKGVCTSYLIERVPLGGVVRIFIQKNSEFRMDKEKAMIMIGPGTGVAPFRSFWREANGQRKDCVLFFGCRRRGEDFLYAEEMTGAAFPFSLSLAFSREQRDKVYVQDKLREREKEVWPLLRDGKAIVYICGDGAQMASDVHNTLVEIYLKNSNLTKEAIEKELKMITRKDVWVV